MKRVLIVGGGAAGMFASIFAAERGYEVHIYEKNEKLGRKLFITGKGRCNITNICDREEMFSHVITNPKFLYSAFSAFSNRDMMEFLERQGLPLKIERGGRVFPRTDKSSDVIATLLKTMQKDGVNIHLKSSVDFLNIRNKRVSGITLLDGTEISGDFVVVATGGLSYPATGSTGDGYKFARQAGHQVTELFPSLVPFTVKERWIKELMGLSLKNIRISISQGQKELYNDFGEMLFTHYGVSGPLLLSASSLVTKAMERGELTLSIDLKPALSKEQLDARVLREFEANKNKQLHNVLEMLLPKKLVPVMLSFMQISEEKKIHDISKEERKHIIECLKGFRMTLTGFRDFKEAIITRGGVSVKEINPSTMESKLIHGLFFIGEVIDVDALTGGFNLQIAWSTAYASAMGLR